MIDSREIVRRAFDDWMNGSGSVERIFAPQMSWDVIGQSAISAKYADDHEFDTSVRAQFAQRFKPEQPFRPINIRGLYADGDTVIVIWDGAGETVADTLYQNTYAWIMTLEEGQVVKGTAFYDSISFNELWKIDPNGN